MQTQSLRTPRYGCTPGQYTNMMSNKEQISKAPMIVPCELGVPQKHLKDVQNIACYAYCSLPKVGWNGEAIEACFQKRFFLFSPPTGKTRRKYQAPARVTMTTVEVPGDGDCFFHCLQHASKRTPTEWRKDIATELLNNAYYTNFFTDRDEKAKHVADLLKGEWATNYEVMAAANILERPIVVYRVNGLPTTLKPERIQPNTEPLYVELDETFSPHYNLLLRIEADLNQIC